MGFPISLATSGAINLISAAVYAFVAARLASRSLPAGSRGAMLGFATFWASIGFYNLHAGALDLLAAAGWTSLHFWIFARFASLLASCVGFAGFLYYMTFVYSGKAWTLAPIAAAYAAFYALLVAYVAASGPIGVEIGEWRTDLAYARALEGPLFSALLLAFILPPAIASLAYWRLRARVVDPAQRARVLLVGAGLVVWFASAFVARASDNGWWQFVTRPLAGMIVGVLVLAAHAPPRWLRDRFVAAGRVPTRAGLERRAAELV